MKLVMTKIKSPEKHSTIQIHMCSGFLVKNLWKMSYYWEQSWAAWWVFGRRQPQWTCFHQMEKSFCLRFSLSSVQSSVERLDGNRDMYKDVLSRRPAGTQPMAADADASSTAPSNVSCQGLTRMTIKSQEWRGVRWRGSLWPSVKTNTSSRECW